MSKYPAYDKQYVIDQLKTALRRPGSSSFCVDGMQAALHWLQQEAKKLPRDPTEAMLIAMHRGWTDNSSSPLLPMDLDVREKYTRAYGALRKLFVPPHTETVWCCSWMAHLNEPKMQGTARIATFRDRLTAERNRESALRQPDIFSLVGPVYAVETEVDE